MGFYTICISVLPVWRLETGYVEARLSVCDHLHLDWVSS